MKFNQMKHLVAGCALVTFASGSLIAGTVEGEVCKKTVKVQEVLIPDFAYDKHGKKHAKAVSGELTTLMVKDILPPMGQSLEGYGMSSGDFEKLKLIHLNIEKHDTYILLFQEKGKTVACELNLKTGQCLGGTKNMIAKE